MSKRVKFLAFVLSVASVCLIFSACSITQEQSETDSATDTEITYENVDVDSYVKSIQYKDLSVTWNSATETKEDAVWNAVYATVTIVEYPEDKVSYYFDQMKNTYMYYAKGDETDYKLLLEAQGISESDMLEKAKETVKEDLVFEYVIKHEGIVVTDAEKSSLFDKYVEKYSAELNKSPEDVSANMKNYIYESMLYDKTTEYLFSVNNIVPKQ